MLNKYTLYHSIISNNSNNSNEYSEYFSNNSNYSNNSNNSNYSNDSNYSNNSDDSNDSNYSNEYSNYSNNSNEYCKTKEKKMIIHQTWKNKNLTGSLKKCQDEWLKYCEEYGYEYKFHTDEDIYNLIKKDFPKYWSRFNKFKNIIEKVDFWRYAILYKEGGIYADLDVFPLKDISELIRNENGNGNGNEIILGLEPIEHSRDYNGTDFMICNAFMISPKKENSFWLKLMDFICKTYNQNEGPVYNTGPGVLTRFYKEDKYIYKRVQILHPTYFYPITNGKTVKTQILNEITYSHISLNCDIEKAYVIHMWDNSWSKDNTEKIYFPIVCGVTILIILIFLITFSIISGYK